MVQLEQGIGNQEGFNFVLAIVENGIFLVGVEFFVWICMIIEVCVVKICQFMCIGWEVGRYLVQNDINVGLMEGVYKVYKFLWCVVLVCWGKVVCDLIVLVWEVGVFYDWQEFYMGKVYFFYVGDYFIGYFFIVKVVQFFVGFFLGIYVDFVYGVRFVQFGDVFVFVYLVFILLCIVVDVLNYRSSIRWDFLEQCKGVFFFKMVAVFGMDMIFVKFFFVNIRNKFFLDIGIILLGYKSVVFFVLVVKIFDYGNCLCIGCLYSKIGVGLFVYFKEVVVQFFVQFKMGVVLE